MTQTTEQVLDLCFTSIEQAHQPGFSIEALEGKLFAHAISAMYLDRRIGGLKSHFRRAFLRQRRLLKVRHIIIGTPRGLQREPVRRRDIGRQIGQHPLNCLALLKRPAEGHAVARVLDGVGEATHGDAETARRDAQLLRRDDRRNLGFMAKQLILANDALVERKRGDDRIRGQILAGIDAKSRRIRRNQK